MTLLEVMGFVAATLTTAAFVPQVFKTFKERSAKDISLSMYLVLLLGIVLWVFYGLYIASMPIVIANMVTGVLVALMIWMKIRFR